MSEHLKAGECECPTRKALLLAEAIRRSAYACPEWLLYGRTESTDEAEALFAVALQSPCPREGMRQDEPSNRAWEELVAWVYAPGRSQEGVNLIYEITSHYNCTRLERDSLRNELAELKESPAFQAGAQWAQRQYGEREIALRAEVSAAVSSHTNLSNFAEPMSDLDRLCIQIESERAQKESAQEKLIASQERERVLREALRGLRAALVVVPVDWANPEAEELAQNAIDADDAAASALATPEGTVRP